VETVDGSKNESERLFEATKCAYAHNPWRALRPSKPPTHKDNNKSKDLPVEGWGGLSC